MTIEELRTEAEKLGCVVKPLKQFVFSDLKSGDVFEYEYKTEIICAMKLSDTACIGLYHDDAVNAVVLSNGNLVYMDFDREVYPLQKDLVFKSMQSLQI